MKEYNVRNLKLFINDIEVECFNSIDMDQYIASYKHLIGCSFKHTKQKGIYIKRADLGLWNIDKHLVSVQDNANYIYQLNNIKLYLDDENLGTYKEYMQLHYPEYKHVWSKQL